jgi:hypothetical protein
MTGIISFIRGWALSKIVCFVFLTFLSLCVRLRGIVVRIDRKVVVLMILKTISIRNIATSRRY